MFGFGLIAGIICSVRFAKWIDSRKHFLITMKVFAVILVILRIFELYEKNYSTRLLQFAAFLVGVFA